MYLTQFRFTSPDQYIYVYMCNIINSIFLRAYKGQPQVKFNAHVEYCVLYLYKDIQFRICKILFS